MLVAKAFFNANTGFKWFQKNVRLSKRRAGFLFWKVALGNYEINRILAQNVVLNLHVDNSRIVQELLLYFLL